MTKPTTPTPAQAEVLAEHETKAERGDFPVHAFTPTASQYAKAAYLLHYLTAWGFSALIANGAGPKSLMWDYKDKQSALVYASIFRVTEGGELFKEGWLTIMGPSAGDQAVKLWAKEDGELWERIQQICASKRYAWFKATADKIENFPQFRPPADGWLPTQEAQQ